jgi:hypothetical protein
LADPDQQDPVLGALLRQLEPPPAPPDFFERLAERRRDQKSGVSIRWRRMIPALAAAVAVGLSLWFALPNHTPDRVGQGSHMRLVFHATRKWAVVARAMQPPAIALSAGPPGIVAATLDNGQTVRLAPGQILIIATIVKHHGQADVRAAFPLTIDDATWRGGREALIKAHASGRLIDVRIRFGSPASPRMRLLADRGLHSLSVGVSQ